MGTRLDLDEYLDRVEQKISLVKRELSSFSATKIPPGVEEGIKLWSLMAVKMALELLREAAAQSKAHETEEQTNATLGNSEDTTMEGEGEGLSESGRVQQRERKRDGK